MLLKVKQVAIKLNVHPNTIYSLIRTGELPSIKIGRSIRINEEAYHEFITKGVTHDK